MTKLHVRKGDNVKIIAGKDKGKTGKIIAVNQDNGRVVVDGANILVKHNKSKDSNTPSSIQKVPGSIDSSNVQIICPSCSKTTRVAKKMADAKSVVATIRVCKKCSASLDAKLEKKAKKDAAAKKSKKDDEAAVADEKATTKAKTATKAKGKKDAPETIDGGDGINKKNADGAIV